MWSLFAMAGRVCLILLWGVLGTHLGLAQPSRLPQGDVPYGRLGQTDRAAGQAALEEFRRIGLVGGVYLEFELRAMPRRGPEARWQGRMWTGLNSGGPITLVRLDGDVSTRLLLQNGVHPALWLAEGGAPVARMLAPAEGFQPLAGTQFTPFLLQMPFLFWNDFDYEGLTRLRGRPAHTYLFTPPLELQAESGGFSYVRAFLDSQFSALNQVVLLDVARRPVQTLSVQEIRKVDEVWMVRTIDLRDERSGNRTRLLVRRAAVGLDLPLELFAPDTFPTAEPVVPPDRLRSLDG